MNVLRLHKKLTISQISAITKISRPTIYLHLDNLEEKGFIKRNKNLEKKGAPVTISVVENSVVKKEKEEVIKLLEEIKKSKDNTITNFMNENSYSNAYANATFEGLIDKKIFLTSKGEKFLKEHSKQK